MNIEAFIDQLPEAHREHFKNIYQKYQRHIQVLREHPEDQDHVDVLWSMAQLCAAVSMFFEYGDFEEDQEETGHE